MILPYWFKKNLPGSDAFFYLNKLREKKLNTVCQSAKCPNWMDCFKERNFTFMILGDTCSRNCSFCAIKKGNTLSLDLDEPKRLIEFVEEFNLDYVIITSVTRDDLEDKGAGLFSRVTKLIREKRPNTKIELLIPDFQGNLESLKTVLESKPDVVGHNLETVYRLYPKIRPQADYKRSLWIIKKIKEINSSVITKSSLILGLGEKEEEVYKALKDLRDARCDMVCLGQYLSPSYKNYPIKEFVTPEKFRRYKNLALKLGFLGVACGPLIRSSYKAKLLFLEAKNV